MPNLRAFFFYLVIVILSFSNCKKEEAQGDDLIFQNKAISLTLAPSYGGRIASLKYDGIEILSQIKDENNWYWGSTVWPAPQSEWNWPPPEKLDQAPYTVKTQNKEVIILQSQKNAYKNIQVEKRFQFIDENSLEIKYSFFNRGDTTIQVGIWENTRVPYIGQVQWKTGKLIDEHPIGLNQVNKISFLNLKGHKVAQKLYIESDGGWITHYRKDVVFTKRFERINIDKVPFGQTQIEVYYDPINKFAELEAHSPYFTIAPSSVATMKVIWKLDKIGKKVKEE